MVSGLQGKANENGLTELGMLTMIKGQVQLCRPDTQTFRIVKGFDAPKTDGISANK